MKKNSVEIRQEIKATYDKIEDLNQGEEPDFEQIEELKGEIAGLEKRLKTTEEIEAGKAKYLEEARKAAQFANVNTGGEPAIPADELSVLKNFSIIRAIGQIKKGGQIVSGTAEEEAMAIAQEEAVHSSIKLLGNIGIPQKLLSFPGRRKVVTVGVEGDNIVDTTFGPKIPLLEIDPAVIRAGSRLFTGQTADLQFPRGETGATVNWEGEVDEAQPTTPTYGNIQLTPNRLAAYTDYSIQAGTQAVFDLEADLRERLSSAGSIEWDRATLLGAGIVSDPITGIINQPGVGVIPTAANKVDWPTALKYPAGLGEANVQIEGPVSYMSTAGVRAHLMSSPKDAGSGLFVMNDAGQVAGFPFWMNNNLPNNGGVGTDEHTMVYGKWSDNYMAQWAGTSILYDPFTQATKGTIRLVLNLYLDSNIAHPESFNYSADIIP